MYAKLNNRQIEYQIELDLLLQAVHTSIIFQMIVFIKIKVLRQGRMDYHHKTSRFPHIQCPI